MILANIINRKDTKAKGFWRFCFVLALRRAHVRLPADHAHHAAA